MSAQRVILEAVVEIGNNVRLKDHVRNCYCDCHPCRIKGSCRVLLPKDAPSLLAAERIASETGARVGSGVDTSFCDHRMDFPGAVFWFKLSLFVQKWYIDTNSINVSSNWCLLQVNKLDLDVRHTRYFSNGKDRTNIKNKNLISGIFWLVFMLYYI